MLKTIKSCKECKFNCCKFGPGPYTVLSISDFLETYMHPGGYNTKCENLMRNGKCKVWGTNMLPQECRTHVCNVRRFTKAELLLMDKIVEGPCENCGAKYFVETEFEDIYICEICNATTHYSIKVCND